MDPRSPARLALRPIWMRALRRRAPIGASRSRHAVTEVAPAAKAPGDRISSREWASSSRARRGLLRSLLIYYGVPFKLRRLADLYRPFVEPGDLCFDVGAHVGDRTRALRRLGGRVVAVEPQPACLGLLRWMYRNDKAVA